MMIEQSQAELARLTQRNASITGNLQTILSQIETVPRSDIRAAYSSAMDAQQRLLMMRGQLDKLQGDQNYLQKYIQMLEKVEQVVGDDDTISGTGPRKGQGSAILEMVVKAQEAERFRLSRQMHDGPAQALSNFIVQTEIASRLFELDPNRAKDELSNLKQAAMTTFQKVRTFIFELRPMSLDDLGLYPTIKRYAEAFKEQTGYDVTLTLTGQEQRFESFVEVLVFRALQELMGNAARHNLDAPSKVQITVIIMVEDNLIKVSVSDNGKGFDPAILVNSEGIGLKLIRERVEMLGGYMDIDAVPGQGSKISFQVPCIEPGGMTQ
ncbi:MAG TPA: sensor histidine kinase [Anaerolineaceae bacterium]|nr:sensor histidine kinase [Anaerolineaceae bacterium]